MIDFIWPAILLPEWDMRRIVVFSGIWVASSSGITATPTLSFLANGNVGVGTNTPKELLSVNGTILSKKVTVSITDLPDRTIHTAKSSPPEVPSAEDVKKNGLDVGDNQATLLKNIEELTLYVVELQNQIKELKEEVKQIRNTKK
jgi:hypothetical protein